MKNSGIGRFKDLITRRWLIIFTVCLLGFVLLPFATALIPSYTGKAELLIVSEALKDTTVSDPDLPSIVTSTEVLSPVIKRLKLDTDPIALGKKVKTKLPAKSSILELSYKDTDAVRAANITNAIADQAALYFHEIATRGYTDVLAALNSRIKESRAKIADTDKRLQLASANSGFASSDKALDDLTSQMNDLQAQRGQLAGSFAADQATAAALKKQQHDISPIVKGEILQKDVVYQTVQTEVGKDVADLVSQRSSFKDSFPGLSALAERVDREKQQAQTTAQEAVANGAGESPSYTQTMLDSERADGVVAADQERLSATDAEIAAEQSHLRDAAGAGAGVGTLRAERDVSLQQYIALTQRLSSAQGDAAQAASLGSLVVVSRAIPGKSTMSFYIAVLAIFIIVLSLVAAYLVDYLDRRFWGVREIEIMYGRPVLLEVGGRA